MDLRQLRYFVGIVEAGSLSRAAAQLNIAQSAISHHLASLETELKLRLMVRGPSGVVLTDAGRSLYRHAQAILRQVEIAKADAMNANAAPSGRVAVGIPTVLSPLLGYRLFSTVRDIYPEIRLSMLDGASALLRELSQNGRLDFALLFIRERERGLDVQPLLLEELFYLSATFAGEKATWEEIAALPLLLPGRESGVRRIVQSIWAEHNIQVETLGEIDANPTLKQAVASGIAGTVLPWSAMYDDASRAAAAIRLIPFEKPLVRPIALCFPEVMARSVATEAVAEILRACIRDLVESGEWHGAKLL
jgi:LysR family nitrogen assimilation transcriptional regulator